MPKGQIATDARERQRAHQRAYYAKNKEKVARSQREYRARNKAALSHQKARWYGENKERLKAKQLMRVYGITQEEYARLWRSQGEACAGCGATAPRGQDWWCVDHCHDTGRVRGILCSSCNVTIGMARESIDVLLDLANYLKKTGG